MRRVLPDDAGLRAAADAIRQGRIVACPTETVYGLAADPFSPEALQRLFEAKRREPLKAVLLVVAGIEQLDQVAALFPPAARRLARAFWPGPLSMLFDPVPGLDPLIVGESGKVCVRCPACDTARTLCARVGTPLTSTSANRSGAPPVTDLSALDLEGVALGIDAGPLPPSMPSTVIDPETGVLLREGAVSAQALEPFLKE